MTTGTRETGRAVIRRLSDERARPSNDVAGARVALASIAGAAGDEPPALAFFDGLADARELAVWGAWRRDRD